MSASKEAGYYERPDEWVGGNAPPQEKAITMKKTTGPRQRGAEVTERPDFYLGGSQPVRPTGPRRKLKANWIHNSNEEEEDEPVKETTGAPKPGKLHIGSTFGEKNGPDKGGTTHHHTPHKLAGGAISKFDGHKSDDSDKGGTTHHHTPHKLAGGAISKFDGHKSDDNSDTHDDSDTHKLGGGSHAPKDNHKKETQHHPTTAVEKTSEEVHQEVAVVAAAPKEANNTHSKVEQQQQHQPKHEAQVEKDAGHYERPDEWVGGHAPPQEKAITMKKSSTGPRQRGAEVTERPGFFLGGSQPVVPTGPRIKLKSNWIQKNKESSDEEAGRGIARSNSHHGGLARTETLHSDHHHDPKAAYSVSRSKSHDHVHEVQAAAARYRDSTKSSVEKEDTTSEDKETVEEVSPPAAAITPELPPPEEAVSKKRDPGIEKDAGNYERPDEWVGGHAPPQEKAITMKKSTTGHRQRGAEVTARPEFFLGGSQPVVPTGPRRKLKANWITNNSSAETTGPTRGVGRSKTFEGIPELKKSMEEKATAIEQRPSVVRANSHGTHELRNSIAMKEAVHNDTGAEQPKEDDDASAEQESTPKKDASIERDAGHYERPDEWVGGHAPPQEKAITMKKSSGPRQRAAEVTERPEFFLGGSQPVIPTGPKIKLKSSWITK